MNSESYEISFVELFQFIRRGFLIALLSAITLAAIAFLIARNTTPIYQARATVLAAQTSSNEFNQFGVSLATAPAVDVSAYQAAVTSFPVIMRALQTMGLENPVDLDIREVRAETTVRAEENRISSLLHISVRNEDPVLAKNRANAIANALVEWDEQRASKKLNTIVSTLESQIEAITQGINALQTTINPDQDQATLASIETEIAGKTTLLADRREQLFSARTLINSAIGQLQTLEPASQPIRPVSPKPFLNAALAGILGVFLSYGFLLLREALNTRLRNTDDLANITGLPILAEFPQLSGGSRRLPPEATSYLRTNLLFTVTDANPKVIVVTSGRASEGKSSVAMNLAESFARNDYHTLLIDADLRKPVVASEYGLKDVHLSLEECLENPQNNSKSIARVMIDTKHGLDVIPTFRSNPAATELLSRGFRTALDHWRKQYDVIIVDSAPVLPVADTLTIAPLCTGTLLIAGMQATDNRSVRATADLLRRMGVRLLGVAATQMVRETRRGGRYGYGYGYGYGGGYGEQNSSEAPKQEKSSSNRFLKAKR